MAKSRGAPNSATCPWSPSLPRNPGAAPERASDQHVVVVAQVKTGISNSPGRAFEVSRLKYSLEFVGAFPTEELDAIVEKLQTNRVVPVGDAWVVGKVLFAEAPEPNCALAVSLDEALEFIEGRLARHRDRKSPDRLSFPDELMQFLAWRGGRSGFGGR